MFFGRAASTMLRTCVNFSGMQSQKENENSQRNSGKSWRRTKSILRVPLQRSLQDYLLMAYSLVISLKNFISAWIKQWNSKLISILLQLSITGIKYLLLISSSQLNTNPGYLRGYSFKQNSMKVLNKKRTSSLLNPYSLLCRSNIRLEYSLKKGL